jgi:hypothetical protein
MTATRSLRGCTRPKANIGKLSGPDSRRSDRSGLGYDGSTLASRGGAFFSSELRRAREDRDLREVHDHAMATSLRPVRPLVFGFGRNPGGSRLERGCHREADQTDPIPRLPFGVAFRNPSKSGAHGHVIEHALPREDGVGLEHESDTGGDLSDNLTTAWITSLALSPCRRSSIAPIDPEKR